MIKNATKAFARYGGVLAISLEWLALIIYYVQYPSYFGREYPISYYATLPGTRVVFTMCYLAAAASFWIFAQHHLRKHLQTPIKTFAVSMASFAGATLVPYNPNNTTSSAPHLILAMLSFVTFIIGMFMMAKDDDKPFQSVSLIAASLSGVLLILFALAPRDSHAIFGLEAGSWFVCQLWILWISWRIYRQ